ncbi:hypothetical protein OC525_20805 [Vibrio vulnificus]|nr:MULTISPECIES: hypothetical protein [Vibrio]MCU8290992.1 hypothetical protein [Vibrio vulnificus]MCU8457270.1 hypothetical protein [Vibrio vulnificus]
MKVVCRNLVYAALTP